MGFSFRNKRISFADGHEFQLWMGTRAISELSLRMPKPFVARYVFAAGELRGVCVYNRLMALRRRVAKVDIFKYNITG